MRASFARLAVVPLGTIILCGPMAAATAAHERRSAGPVQMVVGWASEPTYAGHLNAIQVRLSDAAGPIADVGDALKVEVTFGDQKAGPLALEPAFGSPGEYRAPMVPTRPGAYTFRFIGTVKGQQLDQSFTSSDTTFNSPQEPAEIQFPAKDPSTAQLASRLERVDARAGDVAAARSEAQDAKDSAGLAILLGAAGMVTGLAGLATALFARRRSPGGAAATAQPTASA